MVFEVYFCKVLFENGYVVFVGLECIVCYLENLSFFDSDLFYLEELGYFEEFLDYLKNLKMELIVKLVKEGDFVFVNELLV